MCTAMAGVAGLGAGTSVLAAGFQMWAAHEQGKFQKDMAHYQASLDKNRAVQADAAGKHKIEQNALKRRALVANAKVKAAGSGLLVGADAPGDAVNTWEQDMAEMGAYEQTMIAQNAETESWTFYSNAKAKNKQGSMDRRAATYAMWGAGLQGVSGVANSGMAYYSA